MGGAVSAGENNDELISNLVEADYIKSPSVERVFRAVDRAEFYPSEFRDSAYKDLAWRHPHGNLHISAPCIYSEVMEALDLQHGHSFLNMGSGTGYLSTMAGLLLGSKGLNHGIELHSDVVEYAESMVNVFCLSSDVFDQFDFCRPKFVVGNCLQIPSGARLYDRVYCGAACPSEHESYMRQLIKVGGVLVVPVNDQLLKVRRLGEAEWETTPVLPVSFASLVLPTSDQALRSTELPDVEPDCLRDLCRVCIRCRLREQTCAERPDLLKLPPRGLKAAAASKRRKRRRKRSRSFGSSGAGGSSGIGSNRDDMDAEADEAGGDYEAAAGDTALPDSRGAGPGRNMQIIPISTGGVSVVIFRRRRASDSASSGSSNGDDDDADKATAAAELTAAGIARRLMEVGEHREQAAAASIAVHPERQQDRPDAAEATTTDRRPAAFGRLYTDHRSLEQVDDNVDTSSLRQPEEQRGHQSTSVVVAHIDSVPPAEAESTIDPVVDVNDEEDDEDVWRSCDDEAVGSSVLASTKEKPVEEQSPTEAPSQPASSDCTDPGLSPPPAVYSTSLQVVIDPLSTEKASNEHTVPANGNADANKTVVSAAENCGLDKPSMVQPKSSTEKNGDGSMPDGDKPMVDSKSSGKKNEDSPMSDEAKNVNVQQPMVSSDSDENNDQFEELVEVSHTVLDPPVDGDSNLAESESNKPSASSLTSENSRQFRKMFTQKVRTLVVPESIKDFLLFYRSSNDDNNLS